MRLIFYPDELIEKLQCEGFEGLKKSELDAIIIELNQIATEIELREINLGRGADWIAILVVVNSIVNTFLIGDKLIKGIEGWIEIGSRIKALIKKERLIFIDQEAASLLAIQWISEKERISALQKLNEIILPLPGFGIFATSDQIGDIRAHPVAYFIQTFLINETNIYVMGIKSDGRIKQLEKFNLDSYNPLRSQD